MRSDVMLITRHPRPVGRPGGPRGSVQRKTGSNLLMPIALPNARVVIIGTRSGPEFDVDFDAFGRDRSDDGADEDFGERDGKR